MLEGAKELEKTLPFVVTSTTRSRNPLVGLPNLGINHVSGVLVVDCDYLLYYLFLHILYSSSLHPILRLQVPDLQVVEGTSKEESIFILNII